MLIRILTPLLLAGLLVGNMAVAAKQAAAPVAAVTAEAGEPAPSDMSTAPYNDPSIPPEIIALALVSPN